MSQLLNEIFYNICKSFKNKNYKLIPFVEEEYIMCDPKDVVVFPKIIENDKIIDEALNTLLYEWMDDHKDTRYKECLKYVFVTTDFDVDLSKVSFEELMHFVSPQTKKTNNILLLQSAISLNDILNNIVKLIYGKKFFNKMQAEKRRKKKLKWNDRKKEKKKKRKLLKKKTIKK